MSIYFRFFLRVPNSSLKQKFVIYATTNDDPSVFETMTSRMFH